MKICNKYNRYIIIITLTELLTSMLYGLNHNETFSEVKIASDTFSRHSLIHEFWNYFGTFIIAIIFNKIEDKSLNIKSIENNSNERKKSWIPLIYKNNKSLYNYKDTTNKFIIIYFLTIFFICFYRSFNRILYSYFSRS